MLDSFSNSMYENDPFENLGILECSLIAGKNLIDTFYVCPKSSQNILLANGSWHKLLIYNGKHTHTAHTTHKPTQTYTNTLFCH